MVFILKILDFFFILIFLLNVTKVILLKTKIVPNSIKSSFLARKKALAEGRCSPQELEGGPRSGPHLLVVIKLKSLTERLFRLREHLQGNHTPKL